MQQLPFNTQSARTLPMPTPMTNDMETVEHPIYPMNIMGDGADQHTMRLLNVSTTITRGRVRTMEFVGKKKAAETT